MQEVINPKNDCKNLLQYWLLHNFGDATSMAGSEKKYILGNKDLDLDANNEITTF